MDQGRMSGGTTARHTAFAAHSQHVITCLQFDDDKVVTGSDDTLIHVHDIKSGELRQELRGHESGVWCLQYEGNILVSGSADRSVRVWDLNSGQWQHVLRGHAAAVRCLQIRMKEKPRTDTDPRDVEDATTIQHHPLIISGSRDGQVRVWRLPKNEDDDRHENLEHHGLQDNPYFVRALCGHTETVRHLAGSGDMLASCSDDSTVRIWHVGTGELHHVLTGHSQRVSAIVVDDERNRIVSASLDSRVKVWDLQTGSCVFTLQGHELPVRFLALHREHLSSADDTTIWTWNLETGDRLQKLAIDARHVWGLQLDATRTIWGGSTAVHMQDRRTVESTCLISGLNSVWQVKSDEQRCVAAVQRGDETYVEIFSFDAAQGS
ncbi:cell division control protein 4 [Emericellopsis atlantica]|uniref:Cell division control protein 4 n=1 Tax=Emericellopsis atlantica TaxID=2614577 RepID=A0A9P8CQV6_9HYPO|nr:cell division control protein 4 [Emericellopsis atlantica]KAG9256349.1 cell division control protein 4 [Emericellopsis atlantica]